MNDPKRCHCCMRPLINAYSTFYCCKQCCDIHRGRIPNDNKKYCIECGKEYVITENYQMTCLACKDKFQNRKNTVQEEKLNSVCARCNKNFRLKKIGSSQAYCDECAFEKKRQRSLEKSEKNNIESMKENRRKGGHGISYEKLIAIEEKKRLFDQKYWNTYIRGNTNNKI